MPLEAYWCSVMYAPLMAMLFGGTGSTSRAKHRFGKKIITANVSRRCRPESEIGGILFWTADVMFELKGYSTEYTVIIKSCALIAFCLQMKLTKHHNTLWASDQIDEINKKIYYQTRRSSMVVSSHIDFVFFLIIKLKQREKRSHKTRSVFDSKEIRKSWMHICNICKNTTFYFSNT